MTEHSNTNPGHVPKPEQPGHEPLDASVSTIVGCGVVLAFLIAMTQLILWGLVVFYQTPAPGGPAIHSLAAEQNARSLNERLAALPSPRVEGLNQLQAENPHYRSSEVIPEGAPAGYKPQQRRPARLRHLASYGWVDREKGIAHIPIDQAMRAALKMNLLPSQKAAAPGGKK